MSRRAGHGARGTVGIVYPPFQGVHGGNETTAARWAGVLEALGHDVFRSHTWDGRDCDLLVALHARHSHGSIVAFHRAHPERPIVVAGTGTDLYTEIDDGGVVRESLGLATRIVVLQPLAIRRLPEELRERARVIHQSALGITPKPAPDPRWFEVAYPANVRPVKDPLCAVHAARRLPPDTTIRILHLGGAIDVGLDEEVRALAAETEAFVSLGALPHDEAARTIARSRLVLSTSRQEGGGNVISEAFALDVPVIATHIPGSLGLLGEGYPGTFPVGDDAALAELLERAAADAGFYGSLRDACRGRAWIADPRTERESWKRLFDELEPIAPAEAG